MSIKVKLKTTRHIGVLTGLGTAFLEVDKVNDVEFSEQKYLDVVLGYGFVHQAQVVPKAAPIVEGIKKPVFLKK